MSESLESCVAIVLKDVAATTDVDIAVTPWSGADDSIGFVVHELGVHPRVPVWEAVDLLDHGDSLALHPLPEADERWPGLGDTSDVTITVAGAVQDLIHMMLWERGLDPAWPSCPKHPGRHPLRIYARSLTWRTSQGRPLVENDTGAMWTCPTDNLTIPIGSL